MIYWHKQNHATVVTLALVLFLFPMQGRSQEQSAAPTAPAQGSAAEANGPKVLTLGDAVVIALTNQPAIRRAQERVKAQGSVLGQAKSAYYPTISLNSSYRSTTQSGTTSTSQSAFDSVTSATNLNWTVYDFGKREGSVQKQKDTLVARQFAEQTTVEEVVLNVKTAYYRYLQGKVLVRVREDTVKHREALVRQARGFFEVGTRPRIDVARAETNLFAAQADLIEAQNSMRIAWAELRNTMGLQNFSVRPLAEEALLNKPIETLARELAIRKPVFSLKDARETAYSLRPELKDFDAQRKAQDSAIATARRGHLPDILFNSSYGRRGNSRGSNDTFPMDVNWAVGFNVNVPIFNGFETSYQVKEAMGNYGEIKALEDQTRQQIALDVERSYLNLIGAGERIKATESAVRSAKENLDLSNGRYRVGVGSIIEITEAQVINTQAQTNHIQAITDHKIFEADLAKAMGQGVAR